MKETNIFVVGSVARGESMLGYRKMRDIVKSWAFDPNSGGLSLCGMNRVGKTSIAQEMGEKLDQAPEKKIVYVYCDVSTTKLSKKDSDWSGALFNKIVSSVTRELGKAILREKPDLRAVVNAKAQNMKKENPKQKVDKNLLVIEEELPFVGDEIALFRQSGADSFEFQESFENIFLEVNDTPWRICLVLDEFDAVDGEYCIEITDPDTNQIRRKTGQRFQESDFATIRTLADGMHGMKVLILSRRRLFQIERKNSEKNSTFNGVFRKYCLPGFREEEGDLQELYDTLKTHYTVALSGQEKERLAYYAGFSPLLLSTFARSLADARLSGKPAPEIEKIYDTEKMNVLEYFETIYQRLQEDMMPDGISCEEKVRSIVMGPNIGVTTADMTLLESMGYIREKDNGEGGIEYICLSEMFTQYLRSKPYSPKAWERILKVQEEVSRLIIREVEHERQYSDEEWLILMDYVYRKNGAQFNANKYRWDLKNDRKLCGEHLRMPDILTLKDCFKLIVLLWDERFGVYFDRPKDKGEWEKKFALCGKMRDPLAHGLGGQLPQGQVTLANDHCGEILDSLEKHVPEHEPQGLTAKVKEYIQRELEKKETARPE